MAHRKTRSELESDVRRALSPSASRDKFTILVKNSVLGSARHVGSFDQKQDALDYATREMSRTRKFAEYELWTGTPREPGRFVELVGRGGQP